MHKVRVFYPYPLCHITLLFLTRHFLFFCLQEKVGLALLLNKTNKINTKLQSKQSRHNSFWQIHSDNICIWLLYYDNILYTGVQVIVNIFLLQVEYSLWAFFMLWWACTHITEFSCLTFTIFSFQFLLFSSFSFTSFQSSDLVLLPLSEFIYFMTILTGDV